MYYNFINNTYIIVPTNNKYLTTCVYIYIYIYIYIYFKDTGIYINEHLTKINSDIFFRAMLLRKHNLIHSCWKSNGITFIKLQENITKKEY